MSEQEILVEKHIFRKGHPQYAEMDRITFLSKNLYNSTLYAIRQNYFSNGVWLNYNVVNADFTHSRNPDYTALPTKVSKHTQMLVCQAITSYLGLLKKYKTGELKNKPHLPRYLDSKEGRQVTHYEKGTISRKELKNGIVKLSGTNIRIRTKIPAEQVQFARIVPCSGYITVEIGYKRELCKMKEPKGRYASIDLGIDNLAVVSSNVMDPYIIDGKKLKHINNRYNRELAKRKSQLAYINDRKTSHRIRNTTLKRSNRITDYMHKASAMLVNQLDSSGIDTLVIGYTKGWKQDTDMGKVNNQKFVNIPFNRFISDLEYKCRQKGIRVILHEESYTSKCSFFDDEEITKHETYCRKRVARGLFKTKEDKLINADLNGSLNIMKKALSSVDEWNPELWKQCVMQNLNSAVERRKVILS